ncbi:hypothetical protein M3Y99_01630800 [Aphelenchoides fujianensis]|nr:hypothetical protein M3Y99_01630800 [Aphelenchoides fujianensis]
MTTSEETQKGEREAEGSGFITLGYRGTFAFGRDGQADVKFRKLHRILVCGKAQLCREVFGETLNESRDPDREGRRTIHVACDNLAEKGFKLVTACSSGANGLGGSNALGVQGGGGQQVFNPAFRMVLAAPQQWKTS